MTLRRGAFVAAAAALAVYAGSLRGGFVYDDFPIIVENPLVLSGTPAQFLGSAYWRRPGREGGLYRPLTVASYAVNARLTGLSAPAFRTVNALLHAAVSALAVFLAAALGLGAPAATLAGLAFAVLPVHAEAVAWSVGRAEVLAAGFALGAWLCLLGPLRPGRLAAGALLFLAALLAKESAAALPAAVAAADLARREPPRERAPAWAALAVVVGLYLFWRAQILGAAFSVGRPYFAGLGWPAVPLTMARFFWRGWVWGGSTGLGLCADWSRPAFPDSTAGDLGGWTALLALCAAAAWSVRRRWLGAIVFLVLAAPMSNLLAQMEIVGAERTMYLPSFGLCLLAAALWERLPAGRARAGAAAAVLLAWSGLTAARAKVWGSSQSLWEATAACAPGNPRTDAGLAMVRAGQNRREEARALLRRVLVAQPGHAASAFNLALWDFEDGRPDAAEAALGAFEAASPTGDARIAALRGRIAEEAGRLDEAVVHYRRAVALDPLYALAHRNLGLVLARAGRLDGARAELAAALRLDPNDSELREFLKTVP
ncbi:tetratricopeptide repeat protein [bacterium]|nr:MAG: tetratricopeptide repeat protein [bacterium]